MKGQSTQPVQVRSKEVSVHLGSYPGDGEGDQTVGAPGTEIRRGRVNLAYGEYRPWRTGLGANIERTFGMVS